MTDISTMEMSLEVHPGTRDRRNRAGARRAKLGVDATEEPR